MPQRDSPKGWRVSRRELPRRKQICDFERRGGYRLRLEKSQTVPIGRAGEMHDIAQAMEYLLDARYVTGVNLDVAGGYRL